MHQVKLFKSIESELANLEKEINAWIRSSGARVLSISGDIAPQTAQRESRGLAATGASFAASDVLIVILYETD